jgi:hypothetical protein
MTKALTMLKAGKFTLSILNALPLLTECVSFYGLFQIVHLNIILINDAGFL